MYVFLTFLFIGYHQLNGLTFDHPSTDLEGRAIEFWSHFLGHFVSVLHCRVCACGSYGGGDIHEEGGGRMNQEVSPPE